MTLTHSCMLICLLLRPEPEVLGSWCVDAGPLLVSEFIYCPVFASQCSSLVFCIHPQKLFLNLPIDLSEFHGGTLYVILTLVKILGHIPFACLAYFMQVGFLRRGCIKGSGSPIPLGQPLLRTKLPDLPTLSSFIFQWKNKLMIIWGSGLCMPLLSHWNMDNSYLNHNVYMSESLVIGKLQPQDTVDANRLQYTLQG